MENTYRLLYPAEYDEKLDRAIDNFDFIRALQIDDLVVITQENYRGGRDLKLEQFFSSDPGVLQYRLAVVEDLVEHRELYQMFCDALPLIYYINDLKQVLDSDFSIDSALGSVRYLEMYCEIVEHFSKKLDACEVHSEGLKAFKDRIHEIVSSEEYTNLSRELAGVQTNFGNLKSVTIGINLDENLCPKEAGIVSVNADTFKSGNLMDRLFGKNKQNEKVLISSLYPLTKGLHGEELKNLNYAVSGALHTIFKKSLRDFEPIVQNYFKVNTSFFVSLLADIRFLTAGVKFILDMKDRGFAMCRPQIASVEEKRCDLHQVYQPMLAMKSVEKTIVSNSFALDENGRFYLVTGPNHGGKSIFAYSIGMAQALFQLGLFVPAKSAYMSPVTGIYTHFPASDEGNYGKGRLESECARLSEIIGCLTDTDMLLMDESFSSTSGLEAGYIASEVLTAIGVIGCCGLYVTHIHDLPQHVDEYNSHPDNRARIDNLVAQMENKADGTRSYRIERTTPDGLSYAKDIAGRYGLDLEGILKNRSDRRIG